MAEAEEVLLAAAEQVGAAARALWERGCAPNDAPARRAARAERRIATWLAAAFGTALPVAACDAPLPPGWLGRLLGRPAPWQQRPVAAAFGDGARIFLPRVRLEGAEPVDAEQLLIAALAQGLRAARGRASGPARSPLQRDLRFALEAALGDAELAAAFPGLAPALDAARGAARRTRPLLARLRPAECGVERVVRRLLAGPALSAAAAVEGWAGTAPAADAIADAARRMAEGLAREPGSYRGVAPVEHWGVPAGAPPAAASYAGPGGAPARQAPRRVSLPRHVARRPAEDEGADDRPGPFVLPSSDPQLAVQDARGVLRPEDRGDEDVDALAEELARAGELPVVRSEGHPREVLEGGARGARPTRGPATAARSAQTLSYPEWDFRKGAYRNPGIALRELRGGVADLAWSERMRREHAPLLARIRRHFEALRPQQLRIGRQLEGDSLDLDSIVAEHAERCAGRAPEGRVYRRASRRRRDVAVALLVDASGSTDAWVSRGERAIDVAKQAALCLGEALTALGDRHAVYAFSGRGPDDVRVHVAKGFEEPWGAPARGRIGALQPDGATRLGGPIRHATARLARLAARTRLLLVLSDGKPDDEDAYEGRYGLEDVRQAVFEARSAGVHPFCVTIDRAGPSYLPHLFGPSGFTLLWQVQQLPARLPAIYRRLAVG